MLRGADVSSLFDWASAVSTHGLTFGFARCQRQPGTKDASFDANWQRMRDTLKVRGAYEFALPANPPVPDPALRARNSWTWFSANGLKATDLFCLDLEVSPVGQDETNAWAKAWFDEWERIADRPPGIYLGSGYLLNRTGADLHQYGFNWLWFPRYPSTSFSWPTAFTPQPLGSTWAATDWPEGPDFWQFFGTNSLDPTIFDGDLYNGNLDDLTALNFKNGEPMLGLALGDIGAGVKALQAMLRSLGQGGVTVNGTYDPATSAGLLAVRQSMGSTATSGDKVDHYAYQQLFAAQAKKYAGQDGDVGPQGEKGDPGPKGDIGEPGSKGDPGEPGHTPTKVTIELTGDVTEVT